MQVIGIIGLGYVGLPLALEFGKKYKTIGFDKNHKRINELKKSIDFTLETSKKEIKSSKNIKFTKKISDLEKCNIYIVTVPTPITSKKKPDLKYLRDASISVARMLKKNDTVIYESTVYPGLTEEFCVPILEKYSTLKYINETNKKKLKKGFFCGYSPERINPGDKKNRISKIVKVTSGSTTEISKKIDRLYNSIIPAGTYMAKSIKVAEAAKVIENTQRDVNIALMNELSIIFDKLSIDTKEVLEAAGTKWNFLPFQPGLVGGHCIGIDPYYLTYKSLSVGYRPKVILSGRKINDEMPEHIAIKIMKLAKIKKINTKKCNVLFLGLTFKENCPDIRNSKSIELLKIMSKSFKNIDCYDPFISKPNFITNKNIKLISNPKDNFYDIIVITVAHDLFKKTGVKKIRKYAKNKNIIYDIKSIFSKNDTDGRL